MNRYMLFPHDKLRSFTTNFFLAHGVPLADAKISADILIEADLRGIDSHGITRLNSYYGDRLKKGLINPLSPVTTINETGATLSLDGGNGLGMVVAHYAMERCIRKAKQNEIAMVTVRNSNHYSIAGYYAMMALKDDLIGISLTNTQPLLVPTYGRTPLMGTNPIAVAVPAEIEKPYVLDMATSIVPIGRVTIYQKAGKDIPPGWGVNSEGIVTTSPAEVVNGGALLPLGGTDIMRGYKGYGLSLLVDIFSGVLAGAGFGPTIGKPMQPGEPTNVGHFFAAINISAFRPLEDFKKDIDHYIQLIKSSKKASGEERIYIHGEKEYELAARYQVEGIPLLESVVESLTAAGQEMNTPFDLVPLGFVDKD